MSKRDALALRDETIWSISSKPSAESSDILLM